MTTLALWFTLFLLLALAILLWPLLKKNSAEDSSELSLQKKAVMSIALFVPIFSMGMYFYLGTPQFAEIQKTQIQPEIVTMVDKLEQKMAQNPKDLNGWLLLGRSYMIEENYPKAIAAFDKVLQLEPQNLNALLPLADAIAIQNAGNLSGRPYELLTTALPLAPDNTMTLWLLGMAEKQQNNKQAATEHWLKLYDLLPENSADKTTVLGMLSSVGYIPGMDNLPQPTRAAPVGKDSQKTHSEQHSDNQTTKALSFVESDQAVFELTIEQSFLNRYPQTTLFLYAKEPSGMPMPIAAKQLPLQNLPAGKHQIVLTRDDTIIPNRQIKDFKKITLGYRIMDKASIDQGKILQKKETIVNTGNTARFIIKS